jgi:agmatinase
VKPNDSQFLDLETNFTDMDTAAVAILPVPYEGGVSYGKGAARGPEAIIQASHYLEHYDEVMKIEAHRMGIVTLAPPVLPADTDPVGVGHGVEQGALEMMRQGKFVVLLGGDHSVSLGYARALHKVYGRLSVIQLDAHADLRDTYEGSPYSHACIMSRIREITHDTLQIGVRSMSAGEAERIAREEIAVCTMSDFRMGLCDAVVAIDRLPDPVYITLDVDVFDWSVVRSTGTPEPGGLLWDETLELLENIFRCKHVVGFDVVEFAHEAGDRNSAFAAAKLIYKMLGFKLASVVKSGLTDWPQSPRGPLFGNWKRETGKIS